MLGGVNILDAIRNAPDDAQVCILFRAGTGSGETIFPVGDLKALIDYSPIIYNPTDVQLARSLSEHENPSPDSHVVNLSYGGTE